MFGQNFRTPRTNVSFFLEVELANLSIYFTLSKVEEVAQSAWFVAVALNWIKELFWQINKAKDNWTTTESAGINEKKKTKDKKLGTLFCTHLYLYSPGSAVSHDTC
jgi:hypothetical protein